MTKSGERVSKASIDAQAQPSSEASEAARAAVRFASVTWQPRRKAATAAARAEMTAQVIPILRDVITTDMTAKEIYAAAANRLPANMSAAKVQNILLREMKPELVITEAKGKANTYRKV